MRKPRSSFIWPVNIGAVELRDCILDLRTWKDSFECTDNPEQLPPNSLTNSSNVWASNVCLLSVVISVFSGFGVYMWFCFVFNYNFFSRTVAVLFCVIRVIFFRPCSLKPALPLKGRKGQGWSVGELEIWDQHPIIPSKEFLSLF